MFARVLIPTVLACSIAAQGATHEQWARWIKFLSDPEKRDFAIGEMDGQGPQAVIRLLALVNLNNPGQARMLFYAIGELAHHAGSEFKTITALARECPPPLDIDLWDLIGTVVPFVVPPPDACWPQGMSSPQFLSEDTKHQEKARATDLSQVLTHVLELKLMKPTVEMSTAELIAIAGNRDFPYAQEVAARLLSHRGPEAAAAGPTLVQNLRHLISPNRFTVLEVGDQSPSNQVEQLSRRWSAVALTQVVPGTEMAMRAHGYLVLNGNPKDRRVAHQELRRYSGNCDQAISYLLVGLANAIAMNDHADNTREIMITIGVRSSSAALAAPLLRTIASGTDQDLAAIAKSVLRVNAMR